MLKAKPSDKGSRLDKPQLVELGGDGRIAVTVSHLELGNLVGRLMRMCDLTGDIEQRTALKSTIKIEARTWLDDLYTQAGYYEQTETVKNPVPALDNSPINNK